MKVLEKNAGLLSNFELMDLLRSRGADRGPLGGLVTIGECKVYEYLLETPAGTLTRNAIQDFVSQVKPFKLTEAEKLQSVNLRPSTAVEVHLIVEDCDERLSSAQVDGFIEIVKEILPEPPSRPEEEEEEGEEKEEEDEEEVMEEANSGAEEIEDETNDAGE